MSLKGTSTFNSKFYQNPLNMNEATPKPFNHEKSEVNRNALGPSSTEYGPMSADGRGGGVLDDEDSMYGLGVRLRKPYTITKRRESWTPDEHLKFVHALQLYVSIYVYIT